MPNLGCHNFNVDPYLLCFYLKSGVIDMLKTEFHKVGNVIILNKFGFSKKETNTLLHLANATDLITIKII